MCDTLYFAPDLAGGRAWFAKNSDRNPAEAQVLCVVPRRSAGSELRIAGRNFATPDRGNSFVLSRPTWMEGGEMGVNDQGVAIGNEAVFSRFKAKKEGTLGMTLLRAALSHADSAAEARDFICAFVEHEDQGGNGAYKGSLVYSNSFIVAGPKDAFVLETAGRRWAWKTIRSLATISNAYSIEDDYEAVDETTKAELAALGKEQGEPASWRARVEDRLYLHFTKGDSRRACTAQALTAAAPHISLESLLAALRSHGATTRGIGGMAAPCLHEAGFPMKSTTTASMVFEYSPEGRREGGILWFTGTPYPCLSVYWPLLLKKGEFIPLWMDYDYAEGATSSAQRWERALGRYRRSGGASRSADPEFVAKRDRIQARLIAAAHEAELADDLATARREVAESMSEWEAFLDAQRLG